MLSTSRPRSPARSLAGSRISIPLRLRESPLSCTTRQPAPSFTPLRQRTVTSISLRSMLASTRSMPMSRSLVTDALRESLFPAEWNRAFRLRCALRHLHPLRSSPLLQSQTRSHQLQRQHRSKSPRLLLRHKSLLSPLPHFRHNATSQHPFPSNSASFRSRLKSSAHRCPLLSQPPLQKTSALSLCAHLHHQVRRQMPTYCHTTLPLQNNFPLHS